MAERSPTIEQNSQFSAKTEQGEDVEFNTSLKFYIDPTGDVKVTVVGNPPQGEPERPAKPPKDVPQGSVKSTPSDDQPQVRDKDEPPIQREKPSSWSDKPSSSSEKPSPQSEKPCSMPNFNPCQGINDGVKAVKKFYSSYFGDEEPPKSKKNPNHSEENTKLEKREGLPESEDEVLKNEEKYEM